MQLSVHFEQRHLLAEALPHDSLSLSLTVTLFQNFLRPVVSEMQEEQADVPTD